MKDMHVLVEEKLSIMLRKPAKKSGVKNVPSFNHAPVHDCPQTQKEQASSLSNFAPQLAIAWEPDFI